MLQPRKVTYAAASQVVSAAAPQVTYAGAPQMTYAQPHRVIMQQSQAGGFRAERSDQKQWGNEWRQLPVDSGR